ncbi:MAG TPA: YdcF family protein, partial [Actinomycetota bacterium]|nr:YdcF family protein [Actinomycetota bacterium]
SRLRLLPRHPILATVWFALLLTVGFVAGCAIVVWQAAHHDDASEIDRADAIVVLGAAQYDGDPSPVFAGRLDHAALLYEQGRAPRILVLGGGQPGDRTTEAEAGRAYLIGKGVPEDAILSVPKGHTTFESLRAAAPVMRDAGLGSAFLVSDPWHNARVERMARDLGIDGHASATWQSAATSQETRGEGYLRETFAYLYYRVVGR